MHCLYLNSFVFNYVSLLNFIFIGNAIFVFCFIVSMMIVFLFWRHFDFDVILLAMLRCSRSLVCVVMASFTFVSLIKFLAMGYGIIRWLISMLLVYELNSNHAVEIYYSAKSLQWRSPHFVVSRGRLSSIFIFTVWMIRLQIKIFRILSRYNREAPVLFGFQRFITISTAWFGLNYKSTVFAESFDNSFNTASSLSVRWRHLPICRSRWIFMMRMRLSLVTS